MYLTDENIEWRFFYALLYQQLVSIPELKEYILCGPQNTMEKSVSKMQLILSITDQLNQINEFIRNNNYKLNTVKDFNRYLSYYLRTMVIFNNTINEIGDSLMIRQLAIRNSDIELCTKYFNIVDAIEAKEYKKIIPIFISEFSPYMNQNSDNLRTLSFVSQLSSIQSDKDMEYLLKSTALPIGGASIKRNSYLNISFNGYVGLTGGSELALGSQLTEVKPNLGLAAPVGIAVTGHNRLTYFFSILDLGSMVNQRFGNNTASYTNLRLEHFFTPGLGLLYNFKRIPISMGLHGSYIPNLRNIQYQNNNAVISESNVSVIRINFSVLIDIPFFTLYNQGFKLKR